MCPTLGYMSISGQRAATPPKISVNDARFYDWTQAILDAATPDGVKKAAAKLQERLSENDPKGLGPLGPESYQRFRGSVHMAAETGESAYVLNAYSELIWALRDGYSAKLNRVPKPPQPNSIAPDDFDTIKRETTVAARLTSRRLFHASHDSLTSALRPPSNGAINNLSWTRFRSEVAHASGGSQLLFALADYLDDTSVEQLAQLRDDALDLYSEITERDDDDYIDLRQLKERSDDPTFDPIDKLRVQCEQLQRHGCSVGSKLVQAVDQLGDDMDTDNTLLTMIVEVTSATIEASNERLDPLRRGFARALA